MACELDDIVWTTIERDLLINSIQSYFLRKGQGQEMEMDFGLTTDKI